MGQITRSARRSRLHRMGHGGSGRRRREAAHRGARADAEGTRRVAEAAARRGRFAKEHRALRFTPRARESTRFALISRPPGIRHGLAGGSRFFRKQSAPAARGALPRLPQPGAQGEGRPAPRHARRLDAGRRCGRGDCAGQAGRLAAHLGGALHEQGFAHAGKAQAARRANRHPRRMGAHGRARPADRRRCGEETDGHEPRGRTEVLVVHPRRKSRSLPQ